MNNVRICTGYIDAEWYLVYAHAYELWYMHNPAFCSL